MPDPQAVWSAASATTTIRVMPPHTHSLLALAPDTNGRLVRGDLETRCGNGIVFGGTCEVNAKDELLNVYSDMMGNIPDRNTTRSWG